MIIKTKDSIIEVDKICIEDHLIRAGEEVHEKVSYRWESQIKSRLEKAEKEYINVRDVKYLSGYEYSSLRPSPDGLLYLTFTANKKEEYTGIRFYKNKELVYEIDYIEVVFNKICGRVKKNKIINIAEM